MRLLVLILFLSCFVTSAQYKKVESWISPEGEKVNVGDVFVMGAASGQNDEYLYVHSRPSGLHQGVVHFKAGFDGKKYKIHRLLVDENDGSDGYFIFKYGLAKFMVRANMALKSKEIIMN